MKVRHWIHVGSHGKASLGEDNSYLGSEMCLSEDKLEKQFRIPPAEERVCVEVWFL